jgi:hypothetical protein
MADSSSMIAVSFIGFGVGISSGLGVLFCVETGNSTYIVSPEISHGVMGCSEHHKVAMF